MSSQIWGDSRRAITVQYAIGAALGAGGVLAGFAVAYKVWRLKKGYW